MFDVWGSAQLYASLGTTRAEAVTAEALEILSQAAVRHLGTLIKKTRWRASPAMLCGSPPFKGKKQPLELFELSGSRDDLTREQIPGETWRDDIPTARLKEATLEPVVAQRMGRGAENQFDPLVSRAHARRVSARSLYADRSQPLCRRGMAELAVRREEIALEGSGLIGLGKATGEAPLCVSFTVHRGSGRQRVFVPARGARHDGGSAREGRTPPSQGRRLARCEASPVDPVRARGAGAP